MSEALKELHRRAQALSEEERAELAYLLLRSLDSEDDQTEVDLNATLARRSAEVASGQAVGHPARNVHAEIRQRRS